MGRAGVCGGGGGGGGRVVAAAVVVGAGAGAGVAVAVAAVVVFAFVVFAFGVLLFLCGFPFRRRCCLNFIFASSWNLPDYFCPCFLSSLFLNLICS